MLTESKLLKFNHFVNLKQFDYLAKKANMALGGVKEMLIWLMVEVGPGNGPIYLYRTQPHDLTGVQP